MLQISFVFAPCYLFERPPGSPHDVPGLHVFMRAGYVLFLTLTTVSHKRHFEPGARFHVSFARDSTYQVRK